MTDWFSSLAILWQLALGTFVVSGAIYLINRFFYVDEALDYEQAMDENDEYLSREYGMDLSQDTDVIETPLGYLAGGTISASNMNDLNSLQDETIRPVSAIRKDQTHISPPEMPKTIEDQQLATMVPPLADPAPSATIELDHLQQAVSQEINASEEEETSHIQQILSERSSAKEETAMVDLESLNTKVENNENPYGNSLSLVRGLGVGEILALGRIKIKNTRDLAACTEEQIAQHLPELGNGTAARIKHWVKQAQLIEDGRMDALVEYQDSL